MIVQIYYIFCNYKVGIKKLLHLHNNKKRPEPDKRTLSVKKHIGMTKLSNSTPKIINVDNHFWDIYTPENYDVYLWHCISQLQDKRLFPDDEDSLKRGIEYSPIYTFEQFLEPIREQGLNYHYRPEDRLSRLEYWRTRIEPDVAYRGIKALIIKEPIQING